MKRMTDELERIWKEAVMDYLGRSEENTKKLQSG
jgi:hypothetical protein